MIARWVAVPAATTRRGSFRRPEATMGTIARGANSLPLRPCFSFTTLRGSLSSRSATNLVRFRTARKQRPPADNGAAGAQPWRSYRRNLRMSVFANHR